MTGWVTPGAGPHTGPATVKAPGGSGETSVALPVAGSSTPMPLFVAYAISPCDRPVPACVGEGEDVALGLPLHAARSRIVSMERSLGMRRRDRTGTLLPNALTSVSATGMQAGVRVRTGGVDRFLLAAATTILLTACGASGIGGGSSTPSPTPSSGLRFDVVVTEADHALTMRIGKSVEVVLHKQN